MKEQIREQARDLGFDACGFTHAGTPRSAPHFAHWIQEGWHGTMSYLERNGAKRTDPALVLPQAKSIITLAASYADSGPADLRQKNSQEPERSTPEEESQPRGTVARYAQYADYHDLLREPLRQLTRYVDSLGGPDTRSLWYTDTGPVLERDLAQRAGLGFIGKHTNLIGRRLGNWFFLAEILTSLELEPDPPEQNRCGTCTRCIAACPTRAIRAPFQLDARLCISYLTIELKGPIPVELRPLIGDRIFGCDDCLAVCPWNRFARQGALMREASARVEARPNLLRYLELDEAGFKREFAGTPLLRAKRRGLLRNVCVALGNSAAATALPALERAARDPDPLIAEHAHWAVGEISNRYFSFRRKTEPL